MDAEVLYKMNRYDSNMAELALAFAVVVGPLVVVAVAWYLISKRRKRRRLHA